MQNILLKVPGCANYSIGVRQYFFRNCNVWFWENREFVLPTHTYARCAFFLLSSQCSPFPSCSNHLCLVCLCHKITSPSPCLRDVIYESSLIRRLTNYLIILKIWLFLLLEENYRHNIFKGGYNRTFSLALHFSIRHRSRRAEVHKSSPNPRVLWHPRLLLL